MRLGSTDIEARSHDIPHFQRETMELPPGDATHSLSHSAGDTENTGESSTGSENKTLQSNPRRSVLTSEEEDHLKELFTRALKADDIRFKLVEEKTENNLRTLEAQAKLYGDICREQNSLSVARIQQELNIKRLREDVERILTRIENIERAMKGKPVDSGKRKDPLTGNTYYVIPGKKEEEEEEEEDLYDFK